MTRVIYDRWKVLVLHFGGRKDNSLALEDLVTLVGIIGLGRTSSDMTTRPFIAKLGNELVNIFRNASIGTTVSSFNMQIVYCTYIFWAKVFFVDHKNSAIDTPTQTRSGQKSAELLARQCQPKVKEGRQRNNFELQVLTYRRNLTTPYLRVKLTSL